jgi:predicted GNAT superfamily acetyltransferase
MDPPVAIRCARAQDLAAAAALLAGTLRFTDADAIPAWFMRTTNEWGGITLVAASQARIVGASYAVPAVEDGRPFLFSCGLAVDRAHRGRGLGLQLKLEQRRKAVALGYGRIRWTTDPINGRALRVYLSGLGARVVGYRPGLHDGLRSTPGHPQDDLDIVWHLDGSPLLDERDVRVVELPWAGATDMDDRRRIRVQMSALLADGYVGSGVELDRDARRCRVTFARERA